MSMLQIAYEEARTAFMLHNSKGRGIAFCVHAAVDAAAPMLVSHLREEADAKQYSDGVHAALELAREARGIAWQEQQSGLEPKAWESIDWLCNRLADMEKGGRP